MKLHTPVSLLHGVGKKMDSRLKHLGIRTAQDLLFYFPFRYEDYSQTKQIKDLVEGDEVTIEAKVELIHAKRSARKRMLITEAIASDGTDQLKIIWFRQPYISKTLHVGDTVLFSGKVSSDMFGLTMKSPSYEKKNKHTDHKEIHTKGLIPIYSLTAGITQKQMRYAVSQVLELCKSIEEWVPEEVLDIADLMSLSEALTQIHFPHSTQAYLDASNRLKFDELFLLQLRGELSRQEIKTLFAKKLTFHKDVIKGFVDQLPFTLTQDQKVAAWEILQDMEKGEPMNRLLEGDVGAGKTVVAAIASLSAVRNNTQVAVMAPTEILAKQHYRSMVGYLSSTCTVGIITQGTVEIHGKDLKEQSKKKKKEEFIRILKQGGIDLIIGTHALLTDDVVFKSLGLVIVDEQHRFGVAQRKTIREKSGDSTTTPHFLSMTATPIPRSFALALYGDLDLSIIRHMPLGRKLIKTRFVDPHNRGKAYSFIRDQVKKGGKVFVICPMIGVAGQEKGEQKTVLEEYEKLQNEVFPDLAVGYLHGKMKGEEKDKIMGQFAGSGIDILVSTSVVEVGVDIPNATVMMIEGAERFGLAQLHQFRGRVGRGVRQSYCFVFSDSDSDSVQERLSFFEKTTDGFAVAEYDLHMRGPGEVYGTSQSGMMQLRLATLHDKHLIKLARDAARGIDFEAYPQLKKKIEDWESSVHLE